MLLSLQISNPLYFLQAYTLILWLLKQYFEYSGKILALTAIAVGSSVWETRKVLLLSNDMQEERRIHCFNSVQLANQEPERESPSFGIGYCHSWRSW